MKKECLVANAQFIYSKGELGYQEVLNSFNSASEIAIVTYNISAWENRLISALRTAGAHCTVTIIANIPNRWEYYKDDFARDKAKKEITTYLSLLNPDCLGNDASVSFNFTNHGKIIMTNSIVYIGSANYSQKSKDNFECGFISKDKNFIEYIRTNVLPNLQSAAVPYYEYDYTELLLEANMALSATYAVKDDLCEEVYETYDDMDGKWHNYIEDKAALTAATLDRVVRTVNEAYHVVSDLYNEVANDFYSELDVDMNESVDTAYENLHGLSSEIEKLRYSDTIYELGNFDLQERVIRQLPEEYAMVAYEENLEDCMESVHTELMNEVYRLTQSAKENVETLIKKIQEFCDVYSSLIANLKKVRIKKVNPVIDNTIQ